MARRGVGELPGDQRGEQVRHVRGAGDGGVVLLGLSRTGTAPQSRASASTSSTASGAEPSCGVTAQGRPSNSAALAASGPERSLPAIGWPPT